MTKRMSAAFALSACLVLSSCSGDSEGDAQNDPTTPTPTATVTPTPSSSVTLPAGTELTAPGSALAFGETATVEYSPNQKLDAVLSLTVKNATLGRLSDLKGFNLDTPYKRNANYYFVNVSAENDGDTQLGGRDVPLNGVNEVDTRLPPVVFESAFPRCPSEQLPKKFGHGDTFDTCLVFLAPDKGRLTAVSTLTDGTVEPVTWTGEIRQPPAAKDKKKKQD